MSQIDTRQGAPVSLQGLLAESTANCHRARVATGRSRISVWRWRVGKSSPSLRDAAALVQEFSAEGLTTSACICRPEGGA